MIWHYGRLFCIKSGSFVGQQVQGFNKNTYLTYLSTRLNNFIRQFEHFGHFGQMDRRLIMGQLMIIMLLRQLTDIYASTLFLFE